MNPETGRESKAYFVPDNEAGCWRGEYGYGDYTRDRTVVTDGIDPTDDVLDSHLRKYEQSIGRVAGKTLAQLETEATRYLEYVYNI
jgi:hypothetical protein